MELFVGCTSYSAQSIGGIVGNSNGCTISYCYNTGNIDCASVITECVGGIAGSNVTTTNAATCIQYSYNTGYVSGDTYVGGIAGASQSQKGNVSIENCFNTGSVAAQDYVGGIAGSAIGGYTDSWGSIMPPGRERYHRRKAVS